MDSDIKAELAAAHAEAQDCLLSTAKELRRNGKIMESEALHGAFSILAAADLKKLLFCHDDLLEELYVGEGLGSLRSLPEQVKLANWENVVAMANGFAALASAAPVRIISPLEEEAPELTDEPGTIDLEGSGQDSSPGVLRNSAGAAGDRRSPGISYRDVMQT